MVDSFKDALLFAYHDQSEADKLTISNMNSLEEVEVFMAGQELLRSVKFWIIVDGADVLDVRTWCADSHEVVLGSFEQLLSGRKVFWGVSHQVGLDDIKLPENVGRLICNEGYPNLALETFLSRSVLGAVVQNSEKRQSDVARYAGSYPWFLSILDDCCVDIASASQYYVTLRAATRENMSRELATDLLEDEEMWTKVTRAFESHRSITFVKKDLENNLHITEACYPLGKMIEIDPRYALSDEKYCTPFVEELYIDAFREKEADFAKSRSGPWLDYAAVVMSKRVTNVEIGWICQRLCTDVVSRLGIRISDKLNIIRILSGATKFTAVPDLTNKAQLLQPGHAIIYVSSSYSFGDTDGAVMYRDIVEGQLHLVALQFTTDVEKHIHSADNFMSVSLADEWIPSSWKLVMSGKWKLHFAFICLGGKESEVSKSGKISQLCSDVYFGVLPYTLHIRSFEDALGDFAPNGELEVLRNMARQREERYRALDGCPPFPSF